MTWYATKTESDEMFDTLPEAAYRFLVVDANVKPTKAGDGQIAEAKLEVVEGPAKGGKAWARFNVVNPNATAQKIGRAELKRFLTACGVTDDLETPSDFSRLVARRVVWGEVAHERKDSKTFVRVGGFAADQPGAPAPVRAASPADDRIPF